MKIHTYDDKGKATFDLEGLSEYMQTCIDVQEQRKREELKNRLRGNDKC